MIFLKNNTLITLLFIATSFSLLGQETIFDVNVKEVSSSEATKLAELFNDVQLLEIPAAEIYKLKRQKTIGGQFQFTLNIEDGNELAFYLEENDIRSEDYKLSIFSNNGFTEQPFNPEVITFKGVLNMDSKNKVRMSIVENMISGYFLKGGLQYQIRPVSHFLKDSELKGFLLFKTEDALNPGEAFCSEIAESMGLPSPGKKNQPGDLPTESFSQSDGCHIVRIGTEGDYPFFLAHPGNPGGGGGVASAQNTIHSIINEVEGAYDFGVNEIRFDVVHTGIWNVPNNVYTGIVNGRDFLDASRVWWAFMDGTNGPIERDLVHIFTSVDIETNAGETGLAGTVGSNNGWSGLDAICNFPPYGSPNAHGISEYLVSTSPDIAGQQAFLTAHEIGHNFGALHLNSCPSGSPPDPCPSETIMCCNINQATNFTFTDASENRIMNNTNCLAVCPPCSGCCATSFSDVELITLGNLSGLIQNDLIQNFIKAQKTYIKHEKEIVALFDQEKKDNEKLKGLFDEVKTEGRNLLIKSFAFDQEVILEERHYLLLDQLFTELKKATHSTDLISEIEQVQKYLPVIIDKDLKTAIVDFDRASTRNISKEVNVSKVEEHTKVRLFNNLSNRTIVDFQSVDKEGSLSILLYDLNGRKINTLLAKSSISDGSFRHEIDKSDLAPGVYLIQLQYVTPKGNYQKVLKLPVVF